MNLLIRADATPGTGAGHLMRCLALAQGWRDLGGKVTFVCLDLGPKMRERLLAEQCAVVELPPDIARGSPADALATAALAAQQGARWIVADSYKFDADFVGRLRTHGAKVLQLDDNGDLGPYVADAILNQNLHATAALYQGKAAGSRLLLGANFSLIRGEFAKFQWGKRENPARARKVLVCFGGADEFNVTRTAIKALKHWNAPDLRITVVAGSINLHLASLREAIGDDPRFDLSLDPPDMAALMREAEMAVASAGSISWELMLAGLPTVQVASADNQRKIAEALASGGYVRSAGWHEEVSPARLGELLKRLADDQPGRLEMQSKAAELVDGHGARRVCALFDSGRRLTVISDRGSWLNPFLVPWVERLKAGGHTVTWRHEPRDLPRGDIAFLLSCSSLVSRRELSHHPHNLVVHESALPLGRGWSPLTWQVLEGKKEIPVALFEAREQVDSGPVYSRGMIRLEGHELVAGLRALQAAETLRLCDEFIAQYPEVAATGKPQQGTPTFYRRRGPADSALDPFRTLAEQFNLLRVADNERYPAFFEMDGQRYVLSVRKWEEPPPP